MVGLKFRRRYLDRMQHQMVGTVTGADNADT